MAASPSSAIGSVGLYEAGLVGIAWPEDFGGEGGERLRSNWSPTSRWPVRALPELIGVIALEVVGPSIVAYGSAEAEASLCASDARWRGDLCQGFSEPEAGSDLASLRTRAEDRGDHFVLTARRRDVVRPIRQVVRRSAGSNRSRCLVNTRGISYFVVDMESDGVEVRPLIQLTGDPEFGEVFFDDVVVPKENLIGELNAGWRIALHTLGHERGPAVGRQAGQAAKPS